MVLVVGKALSGFSLKIYRHTHTHTLAHTLTDTQMHAHIQAHTHTHIEALPQLFAVEFFATITYAHI